MNWEALGAIGDFMGGVVVIVSVAYLAVQIRQSNRHAEASAELSWLQGLNDVWDRWTLESTMNAVRKGLRYWELDSQASPAAPDLMAEIERRAPEPRDVLFPWWHDDRDPEEPRGES